MALASRLTMPGSDPATKDDLDVLGTSLRGEMEALGTNLRGELAKTSDKVHQLGVMLETFNTNVLKIAESVQRVEALEQQLPRRQP